MKQVLRLFVAALSVIALASVSGMVWAQAPKQIKLSEQQIENFIAAHKAMMEAFEKVATETSDKETQQKLDTVAKKYGFKNNAEYEVVVSNIDMIMFGLDPETKAFTDPPSLVKKEIEEAKADKALSDEERKQVVEELTEQLKMAQPIKHQSNVELVKKYYDKLEPLLQ